MRSRWLPPQHGAWAMLAVPFAAGTFLGRPNWLHVPLLVGWFFGYLATYHFQQYVRLRRLSRNPRAPRRHVRPMVVFGAGTALVGVPLAVLRPWLLVAVALALPFLAVNTLYAWRNRERALLNGLVAVVPACGMLLVALKLGGGAVPADGWRAAVACLLYFGGTVPYVKTMIRERANRAYRWGSGAYHVAAVAVAGWLQPLLAVPFMLYLLRALVLPGRGLKAPVVGAVEVVGSLLLLVTLLAVPPG